MVASQVYWIDGVAPGRIAIMARPRGGNLLAEDVGLLRDLSVDAVVSLLMEEEAAELQLADEGALCVEQGLEFLSFPIKDRYVPIMSGAYMEMVRKLVKAVAGGKSLAIHCRMGIGRSSLVASCVLIMRGIPADEALKIITKARGLPVPDTADQRSWLLEFEEKYLGVAS